jgi:hypothetical protein
MNETLQKLVAAYLRLEMRVQLLGNGNQLPQQAHLFALVALLKLLNLALVIQHLIRESQHFFLVGVKLLDFNVGSELFGSTSEEVTLNLFLS